MISLTRYPVQCAISRTSVYKLPTQYLGRIDIM